MKRKIREIALNLYQESLFPTKSHSPAGDFGKAVRKAEKYGMRTSDAYLAVTGEYVDTKRRRRGKKK